MKENPSKYHVVVVGSGIAGCAIAKALADQGRQVLVVERQLSEPDRIAGELLQPGGVLALSKLGLDDCVKDIEAIPVTGYHIFWKGEQEASFEFCPLPGETEANTRAGKSFHHGRFVGKLCQRLISENRVHLVEKNVVDIIKDDKSGKAVGVVCSDEKSTKYYGDLIIMADGATSNFSSQILSYKPTSQSRFWGLELTNADLPFQNYAHGILGSGPPVLIYQISKSKTRVLVDMTGETYQSLRNKSQGIRSYFLTAVLPILPAKLQPSFHDAVQNGRLRSIPNRCMPSSRMQMPGLIVLGDALNMRHPLTGGGMTIALKDAISLADLLAPVHVPQLSDHNLVLRRMNTFH